MCICMCIICLFWKINFIPKDQAEPPWNLGYCCPWWPWASWLCVTQAQWEHMGASLRTSASRHSNFWTPVPMSNPFQVHQNTWSHLLHSVLVSEVHWDQMHWSFGLGHGQHKRQMWFQTKERTWMVEMLHTQKRQINYLIKFPFWDSMRAINYWLKYLSFFPVMLRYYFLASHVLIHDPGDIHHSCINLKVVTFKLLLSTA